MDTDLIQVVCCDMKLKINESIPTGYKCSKKLKKMNLGMKESRQDINGETL